MINYKEIGRPHIDRFLPLHCNLDIFCMQMNEFQDLDVCLAFNDPPVWWTNEAQCFKWTTRILIIIACTQCFCLLYSLPKKICWFIVGTKFSTLSGLKKTIRFGRLSKGQIRINNKFPHKMRMRKLCVGPLFWHLTVNMMRHVTSGSRCQ